MRVVKSSRHSKVTGDFGEALVLYWLSKHGFACARVDHTGIDLIARNPHTDELMGISVKSRSRNPGKEKTYLRIPLDNLTKVREACEAFGCVPYFAIVVDAADLIRAFILSMEHLLRLFPPTATSVGWKMTPKHLAAYFTALVGVTIATALRGLFQRRKAGGPAAQRDAHISDGWGPIDGSADRAWHWGTKGGGGGGYVCAGAVG
jgi:Holliday junction resolvase-like predicted endonuclease